MLNDKSRIKIYLHRHDYWAKTNKMQFSRDKYKILCLSSDNCTNISQICLSLAIFYGTKNFSDFSNRNFNRSQVPDLALRKAGVILGCLSRRSYLRYAAHLIRKAFAVAICGDVTHRTREVAGLWHSVQPCHLSALHAALRPTF